MSDLQLHAINWSCSFGAKLYLLGSRTGINLFSMSKTNALAQYKYHIANDKFQIGLIKMLEILRNTLCNFDLFIIIIFGFKSKLVSDNKNNNKHETIN